MATDERDAVLERWEQREIREARAEAAAELATDYERIM